ncbi:hypothetical protein NCAS_0A13730 [Naumovozyma castellii]|uniref:Uncharacterized protein n=1 Tax=Naumovozyma castellii TaxID=27288 RepID=G0V8Y2_NAUCA|nr:hypothetical protein NCAS_0A13730 [Naumovozyma castellii CBS 4309]CCC67931.1 hypothetical protein NCAS_0A13730 [Naumovozyma castellii CBS 4309]
MCCCCVCTVSDFFLYILAICFPPVAVLLRSGVCSSDFWLNVVLTCLGFMPGMVHAFYYITVTSPLRRDPELIYFYQQGWVDSERNAGEPPNENTNLASEENQRRDYTSLPNPLITGSNNYYSNNISNDTKMSPSGAPPPYSN